MGLIKAPHQFETSAETPHGLAPSATSAANCSLIHRKAKCLFIQARGVLKKELLEHLRAKRTIRRSRHASLKRNGLGQIKDAVSISERPASVEDRVVPGHWEGDLIGGAKNSYVATLVERHSRYVMLIKVANQGYPERRHGSDQTIPQAARRTVPVTDLGPGTGTGRS